MAFRLSVDRGYCPPTDAERAIAHLEAAGLPTTTDVDPERLAARMRHDKKGGVLILSRGIGQAFVDRTVSPEELGTFLARDIRR